MTCVIASLLATLLLAAPATLQASSAGFYKYSDGGNGSPSGLDADDHQVSFALHFFY